MWLATEWVGVLCAALCESKLPHQPLAGAIVAWRNSLVFHSLDKVTSVYIHILPALLTYVWRWMPENQAILRAACQGQDNCTLSYTDWLVYPMLFYIGWQIFYLWFTGGCEGIGVLIFVVADGPSPSLPQSAEVLNRRHLSADDDLQTSLRWLAKTKTGISGLARSVCVRLRIMRKDEEFDSNTMKTKAIFVIAQMVFTIITMLPCKVWWRWWFGSRR